MAVTITWVEFNGSETPGSAVGSTTTNINLGSVDSVNLTPADAKILIGARSFFKQGLWNTSGSMTSVENFRIHKSAGAYKTEEVLEFSGGGITASAPDATDQGWPAIPTSEPSANVILPNTTGGVLQQADQESTPGYTSGSRSGLCGFQLLTTVNTETGAVNEKTITLTYDIT
ncbi:hypothetical protein LCGC14_2502280 [marine sediment metagenome]|uniref:Uncharacterized protein n=1 Tax=marine sediment metagenome TaxID=412755 RepID=A0A0F9B1J2_9ZZZZ